VFNTWRGGTGEPAALLVTSREGHLAEAYKAEVSVAAPGALHIGDGVYVVRPAEASVLARMASLRCQLDVLAAAPNPTELVARVAALRFAADQRAHGLTWELHSERRHDGGAGHIPTPEMQALLSQACGRHLRIARGPAGPDVLRFAHVETAAGSFFGAITYAPGSTSAVDEAWTKKPHNYGAGMMLPLARLGLNLATGMQYDGTCIADPCCGSGTILLAAQCLGAASVGGLELHAAVASHCRANLAALRGQAVAERRRVAEEASGRDAPEDAPHVSVLTGDAMHTVLRDCTSAPVDCICSNLPFGRWVGVGGQTGGIPMRESHAESLPRLLEWLHPQAPRHAYFSGSSPLGELMDSLGYKNILELDVHTHGKRWLTLATR
jgi:hypothetical protein